MTATKHRAASLQQQSYLLGVYRCNCNSDGKYHSHLTTMETYKWFGDRWVAMADSGAESVHRQWFRASRITRRVGPHTIVLRVKCNKKTFLSLKKIKSTSKSENFFSGRHYRCRQALRFASVVAAALNTSESRHFCRCDLAANKVIKSERYIKIEYAYCFHNYSDYVYQKLSKLVHVTRS